jgi:hypothetical protein
MVETLVTGASFLLLGGSSLVLVVLCSQQLPYDGCCILLAGIPKGLKDILKFVPLRVGLRGLSRFVLLSL